MEAGLRGPTGLAAQVLVEEDSRFGTDRAAIQLQHLEDRSALARLTRTRTATRSPAKCSTVVQLLLLIATLH